MALDDADAKSLLADPTLEARRHYLESARRYRPHVLGEKEEQILEDLSNTGNRAWSRLFDEVMGAARFSLEEDGETLDLSEEEVLSRLYHPERDTRRAAAARS